ncbi:MAG: tetratricopeptide repeat protein, partial [Bryobacteraceae bacterium]
MADVEKLLDRAKRYLEKNKTQDAIDAYLAVLEASPAHPEAVQSLGDLYIHQGDGARAAVYYGMLFDRLTDPREEPKAAALYSRFLRGSEQTPERQFRYATILHHQNKTSEALENYTVAGEHFMARGREDDALRCLEQAAELDPDNGARQISLAQLAEKRGRASLAAR